MKFIIFLGVLLLYFYNLGYHQVWSPNEGFYADASKNMLKTGDFLTPIFNGEIRLNKPPVTYWLTAFSFFIFGLNEFALRFFQAILGYLTSLITYFFAKELYGEKAGILAFLSMSLSFLFFANSRYTSPEVPLTFFITLSIYLWYLSYTRKNNLLFLLALTSSAFAVLTKGPVGFVMPAFIIFVYLLLTDYRELLKIKYYLGTLYVIVLSGWWYLYQYIHNREILLEVFVKENIKRIYAMESDPIYQHFLDINVSFLPYSFIFYISLIWALKERRKELYLPIIWSLSFLIIFSIVKMKLPTYMMPAYPSMAMLVGAFLSSDVWNRVKTFSSVFLGIFILTAVYVGTFIFSTNFIFPVLFTLLLIPFFLYRLYVYIPAFSGFMFLLYFIGLLLPQVEKVRYYREIGEFVKSLDPEGKMKFYEVGAFHYNLPFYADRRVIPVNDISGVEKNSLILVREDIYNCKALAEWKLYKGSESKLFKFLMDVKRGRNIYTFRLCLYK